jgi:hypothetical protein
MLLPQTNGRNSLKSLSKTGTATKKRNAPHTELKPRANQALRATSMAAQARNASELPLLVLVDLSGDREKRLWPSMSEKYAFNPGKRFRARA